MRSTIIFFPNTHQQQHFATSFNAFRHRYLLRCAKHYMDFSFKSQAVSGCLCQPAPLGCELKLNPDSFMNATYLEDPSEC
jgi:hypothetical protein